MGAIEKKLRSATGTGEKRFLHWCPGCAEVHSIRIECAGPGPVWSFNGDLERPTFSPSIRISEGHDDEGNRLPQGQWRTLCHYFIRDGRIEFCSDSPHPLAGQTVDLPDWPYAPGTYGGIDETET